MKLGKDSIFVVTGAAGSIVSAITRDLAAASGGVFYLLDLVPLPNPADPDMARLVYNREALKAEIGARLEQRGERVTPVLIERELAMLERARSALAAIQGVEWAGGAAHYISVDLRDPAEVARVVDEVRRAHGRIDVLLHGAGLDVGHLLSDKSADELSTVFGVRGEGWYNLWHAVGDMPVHAAIAFSSIAGRFGNAGQTDYSAAHELLSRTSAGVRTTNPETRAIVIDWTAWSDIGMASRGSLPLPVGDAGVEMLPPTAAIPAVRRAAESAPPGEAVIAKRLRALLRELDPTGDLDIVAAPVDRPLGPMLERIESFTVHGGLTVSSTLDPRTQPFLDDHRIDGTAVLPAVMGVEAFAEAASHLFPGWRVAAVENLEFLAPFEFHRDEPRIATVRALFRRDGDDIVASCHLEGTRDLPRGAELTTHFIGQVRLSRLESPTLGTDVPVGPDPDSRAIGADEIYRVYFHGPAYRVLERAWREGGRVVGEMSAALPPNHAPAELPLAFAPRLLELCFQTAGLHDLTTTGTMGLPNRVARVRLLRADAGVGRLFALVTPGDDGYDATVTDEQGVVLMAVEGYRTCAMPQPVPPDLAESLRTAFDEREWVERAPRIGAWEGDLVISVVAAPAAAGTVDQNVTPTVIGMSCSPVPKM